MQSLSLELKPYGVAVCCIHPGWVNTEMGGKEADIQVKDSASGIIQVINNLTLEKTGMFFTWEGKEHAW